VANAIRYTKAGLVQLRCVHSHAYVQIDVVDTGVGIPNGDLQLIFEEFYQAPLEAGARREGLGLGLSIVRRVAELLDVRLEVESTPGRGSRFRLNVPRGSRLSPAATQPALEPSHDRNAVERVVLVVDDDAAVAAATAMLLEVEGYQPLVAASLDDALCRLTEATCIPNVIICDYQLGSGPSGVETIRKIREMCGRRIRSFLVTGDTSSSALNLGSQIEDCTILSKPMDATKLLGLLEATL
jgi:CheY-like chemotaxis protein